jgi:hypothetical protein
MYTGVVNRGCQPGLSTGVVHRGCTPGSKETMITFRPETLHVGKGETLLQRK